MRLLLLVVEIFFDVVLNFAHSFLVNYFLFFLIDCDTAYTITVALGVFIDKFHFFIHVVTCRCLLQLGEFRCFTLVAVHNEQLLVLAIIKLLLVPHDMLKNLGFSLGSRHRADSGSKQQTISLRHLL